MKTMPRRFRRRTVAAFGGASALALLARPQRDPVRAAPALQQAPLADLKPGFAPVPSALAFGPPADLAAGWDGTLWAIDAAGAPHVYDPIAQVWQPHGRGVEAVAWAPPPGLAAAAGTATRTPTATPTATPAAGSSDTPTPAASGTAAATGTAAARDAPTGQPSPTPGASGTPWPVATHTPAAGASPTVSPPATATHTPAPPPGSSSPGAATDAITDAATDADVVVPIVALSAPPAQSAGGPTAAPATVPPRGSPTPAGTPGATATGTPGTAGTGTPTAMPALGEGTPMGLYAFRGAEVLYVSGESRSAPGSATTPGTPTPTPAPTAPAGGRLTPGAPQSIAAVFPDLPPSFQQDLDGAADVDGVLHLFKAGRYVRVDRPAAPRVLTALAGWPQTPAWAGGVFDLVGSGHGDAHVVFIRAGALLIADMSQGKVVWGPRPLGAGFAGDLLARLRAGGVDALLYDGPVTTAATPLRALQGPAVVAYAGAQAPQAASERYLPQAFGGWPYLWNPRLLQAPAGRVGALWATAEPGMGYVIAHDGTAWSDVSLPGGASGLPSVAAGADGAVFAGSGTTLYHLDQSGAVPVWRTLAATPAAVAQTAAGDAAHVWVRDAAGGVHRYAGGTAPGGGFTAADLGTPAAHVAANADGTLWHAAPDSADAFRFVSEGTQPAQALGSGQPGVTAVRKVASTGFGRAHLLVDQNGAPQLLRYDSPFLFKTGPSYNVEPTVGRFDTGLGNVYVLASGDDYQKTVVALDARTGGERWRFPLGTPPAWVMEGGWSMPRPVFDPLQECVYAGALGTANGFVVLDARTGAVRGSLPLPANVALTGAAAVQGTTLVFGDSTATVRAYDTAQVMAAFAAGSPAPAPLWETPMPTGVTPGGRVRSREPLLANGRLYVAVDAAAPGGGGEVRVHQLDPGTGAVLSSSSATVSQADWPAPQAPILGAHRFGGVETPALLICTGEHSSPGATAIVALGLGPDGALGGPTAAVGDVGYVTGVTYHRGVLYFFGVDANREGTGVYGLDGDFRAVPGTPWRTDQRLLTTPAVVTDGAGRDTVFFSGGGGPQPLYAVEAYQPASGTSLRLDTNQTSPLVLSPGPGGVLYVGGGSLGPLAQVFAIRTDVAIQGLRAIVAESQLLQDFDEPTPGALAAVARYQTHLTVVDDRRVPQAGEPVTIWADAPTTVRVDGRPHAVGPRTPAAVQTGPDGSLTVISDAADLTAPPLRLWAPFMDPYERIVVYPDQELHGRLATATVAQPGGDDPTQVNLSTARPYGGAVLFPDPAQAQQLAGAVRQLAAGVGLGAAGAGVGAAPAGGRRPAAAVAPAGRPQAPAFGAAGAQGKYIPYADLPGMLSLTTDTPARRAPVPAAPVGLILGADGTLSAAPVAAAQAAADALQGPPPVALGGFFSFLEGLWTAIKQGAATVAQVVVTVAGEVGLALQYVRDGATYVFRTVVHTLEDVAAAVGAWFVKLGKTIEEVVQALSLVFDLTHIRAAQQTIVETVNRGLTSAAADLTGPVRTALDGLFASDEAQVAALFEKLRAPLGPLLQVPVAQLLSAPPGASDASRLSAAAGPGATEHTLFAVRPKGATRKTSQAVPCAWALRKLTRALADLAPVAAAPATASGARTGRVGSPPGLPAGLQDFFTGFLTRLRDDPVLSAAVATTKADFRAGFGARVGSVGGSVGDFFERLTVADLLDLLQDLVVGGLAVASALVDGLLRVVADVLTWLRDTLNAPLHVPVLSTLFGAVSLLDLLTAVLAVPAAWVVRLADGAWPVPPAGAAAAAPRLRGQPLSGDQKLFGIAAGVATVVNGALSGLGDALTGVSEGSLQVVSDLLFAPAMIAGVIGSFLAYPPLVDGPGATGYDWGAWGGAWFGLVAGFLTSVAGLAKPALATELGLTASVVTTVTSAVAFVLYLLEWFEADQPDDAVTRTALAANELSVGAGLLNLYKYLGDETYGIATAVVAGLDVFAALGAAACAWTVLGLTWDG